MLESVHWNLYLYKLLEKNRAQHEDSFFSLEKSKLRSDIRTDFFSVCFYWEKRKILLGFLFSQLFGLLPNFQSCFLQLKVIRNTKKLKSFVTWSLLLLMPLRRCPIFCSENWKTVRVRSWCAEPESWNFHVNIQVKMLIFKLD